MRRRKLAISPFRKCSLETLETRDLMTVVATEVNPANGHTYHLIRSGEIGHSWFSAREEALSLGGDLVTINDAAENRWISETFSVDGLNPSWIGLSDARIEGDFEWASGEEFSYSNWLSFQSNSQDYVIISDSNWRTINGNELSLCPFCSPGFNGFFSAVVEVPTIPSENSIPFVAIDLPSQEDTGGTDRTFETLTKDFDNDGDLDVFVSADGADSVFINDGDGNLFLGQRMENGHSIYADAGDVDGDADVDIIIASIDESTLWLNDGSGNFLKSDEQQFDDKEIWSQDVALGDLDGDGDLDAYFANRFLNSDPIHDSIYLNDGLGNFTDSGQRIGLERSTGVELSDLDGDGDLDAVVSSREGVISYFNQGDGTFVSGVEQTLPGGQHPALGDIDLDGDTDLIIAGSGPTRVWANDGSGGFTDTGQLLGDGASSFAALEDFDNDGDVDLYVSNWTDVPNKVWTNDGFGNFVDSGVDLSAQATEHAAVGDFDGDDDLDIFASIWNGPNVTYLNLEQFGSPRFDDHGNEPRLAALPLVDPRPIDYFLGELQSPQDSDWFQFEAFQGNEIEATAVFNSVYSDSIGWFFEDWLLLRIYDGEGTLVEEVDPSTSKPIFSDINQSSVFEVEASWTVPENGLYYAEFKLAHSITDPADADEQELSQDLHDQMVSGGFRPRYSLSVSGVSNPNEPPIELDLVPLHAEDGWFQTDRNLKWFEEGALTFELLLDHPFEMGGREIDFSTYESPQNSVQNLEFCVADSFGDCFENNLWTMATTSSTSATTIKAVLPPSPNNRYFARLDVAAQSLCQDEFSGKLWRDVDTSPSIVLYAAMDNLPGTTETIHSHAIQGFRFCSDGGSPSSGQISIQLTDLYGTGGLLPEELQVSVESNLTSVEFPEATDQAAFFFEGDAADYEGPIRLGLVLEAERFDFESDDFVMEDYLGSLDISETLGVVSKDVDPDLGENLDWMITFDADGTDFFLLQGLSASNASDGPPPFIKSLVVALGEYADTSTSSPPVAQNDSFALSEDGEFAGNLTSDNGSGRDVDPNGDVLFTTVSILPQNGTLDLQSDGEFEYRPNANYFGTDSFTYFLSDGNGGISEANASLFVLPINDHPLAKMDIFELDQDSELSGNVLLDNGRGVDSDAESDVMQLIVSLSSAPNNGSLDLNLDGIFAYIPDTGFIGTDGFGYLLRDEDGGESIGTVTINVQPSEVDRCSTNLMAGDFDGDGTVAFSDFLVLSANFGSTVNDPTLGDADCNGDIQFADFLVLSSNFGRSL